MGGEAKIKEIVDRFYIYLVTDPMLSHYFTNISMGRMHHPQSGFLARMLGSKKPYQGKPLREAHKTFGITHDQFDQALFWLVMAAQDAVPDANRVILKAVIAKLETLRALIVTKDLDKRPSRAVSLPTRKFSFLEMQNARIGDDFKERFRISKVKSSGNQRISTW